MASAAPEPQWQKTACILCSLNCGLDVQVGGPGGRHLVKIKGDRDHPISRGYFCEKAQRLDFYQTAGDRLDSPLRRPIAELAAPPVWMAAAPANRDRDPTPA